MEYTPASVKGDHVLLTGPITGTVTLEDGTVVDVTQPVIAVTDETAAEIAHKIGERYAAEGHPEVEGDFDYKPAKKTAKKKG